MPTSRPDIQQYQYLYERPSAQSFGRGQCQVAGAEYFSDGERWVGSPKILANNNTGYILSSFQAADASTYSQAGTTMTVTATGHLMTAATSNGRSIYLGIASGSAVSGWYTNFTYVDANTFTCTAATSITTTGTISSNTAETTITPLTVTVPANSMGPNGKVRVSIMTQNNNSAGAKTPKIKFGGTQIFSAAVTTTTTLGVSNRIVSNRGTNTSAQITDNAASTGAGTSSTVPVVLTVDTTADTTITFTGTIAVASDWLCFEVCLVELLPGI